MTSDPWLAGARALKQALNRQEISRPQYDEMYAALAAAAERDSVACEVRGCERAAYIGTRCAHHTTVEDVRSAARKSRYV